MDSSDDRGVFLTFSWCLPCGPRTRAQGTMTLEVSEALSRWTLRDAKTLEHSVMETNLLACRNSSVFGYQFVLEFHSRKVSCTSDVMEKFKYLCQEKKRKAQTPPSPEYPALTGYIILSKVTYDTLPIVVSAGKLMLLFLLAASLFSLRLMPSRFLAFSWSHRL